MEYKNYKHDTYTLYTIKTDKFKTCHMEIIFKNKINKEEITILNLLGTYLAYTSQKYPKRRNVIEALEDLYDTNFYETNARVGKNIFVSFIMDFLEPTYCEKDFLDQVLSFPFEFIFNPNFKNTVPDKKIFDVIVNMVKSTIMSSKDSPTNYAFKQAFKTLGEDNPAGFDMNGDIDILRRITPEDLYSYYQRFLKEFSCDIYIIGNLDMEYVDMKIKEFYKNNYVAPEVTDYFINYPLNRKVTYKCEMGPYEQSSFIMLYKTDMLTDKEKNYVIHYFNSIFGSGSLNNKLNQYLREENGLCYSTYSLYQKIDNLFIVYAGIDAENKDACVRIVKKALKEMQQGNFTEEEITFAKENLINQIKMSYDTQTSILDNYAFHNLIGSPLLNVRIKEIENVTKEEIIELAKKIKLNSIYLLGGTNAKENQDK